MSTLLFTLGFIGMLVLIGGPVVYLQVRKDLSGTEKL